MIAGDRKGVWLLVKNVGDLPLSGDNAPETQNFKFVAWDAVRRALQLR